LRLLHELPFHMCTAYIAFDGNPTRTKLRRPSAMQLNAHYVHDIISSSGLGWTEVANQAVVDMSCSRLLSSSCFKSYETSWLKNIL